MARKREQGDWCGAVWMMREAVFSKEVGANSECAGSAASQSNAVHAAAAPPSRRAVARERRMETSSEGRVCGDMGARRSLGKA